MDQQPFLPEPAADISPSSASLQSSLQTNAPAPPSGVPVFAGPQLSENGVEIVPVRHALAGVAGVRDSGAKWLYYIAGLSAVNSVLSMVGADISFALGLGLTQIIDAIPASKDVAGRVVALAINLVIIGLVFLLGAQAAKGKGWAFAVGTIWLVLDTLLLTGLAFTPGGEGLILGILFHVWATIRLVAGWRANGVLRRALAQAGTGANSPWHETAA